MLRSLILLSLFLAGGPINSPQLLKLSGIGPADELRAQGLSVVADRAGVGENLQDLILPYVTLSLPTLKILYALVKSI